MLPGRNLRSYLVRLRNATTPEVAYRVRQALLVRNLRGKLQSAHAVLSAPLVDRSAFARLILPDLTLADNALVQSILEGKRFTLHGDAQEIARFEEACSGRFFTDIALPDSPDIRQVWEPARLQHITILLVASAQDAKCTHANRLSDFAKGALLEWIGKNPFLKGPHYLSAMECGLRIPVFFYGLKLLDNLSDDEVRRILCAIYEHAWWVSRRLSLFTSLGNHTVCECIGLIFAGAAFRRTPEGSVWLERGTALLRQELMHQILDDGGPAEQSLAYHRFVLDLYWLAVDFLERNGLHDCAAWKHRLLSGESFLSAFTDGGGRMPSISDSDDGCAIAPGLTPHRGGEFSVSSDQVASAARLIHLQGSSLNSGSLHARTFPDSGCTVVRGSGIFLTFDHGPLGMAPLYNHGHADALAITLTVADKPFLVDPGTYRYNGEPEFRRYFKGTRAHNTVTVDGEDQAVQETGFVWRQPYRSQLTSREESGSNTSLEAKHDGYVRLRDRVIHARKITYQRDLFLITDRFEGKGVHDFELNFYLHPDVRAQRENGLWCLRSGDREVFIRLFAGPNFALVSGQEDPPFGWFSPSYGYKEKSGVLSCRKRGTASDTTFHTAISIGRPISLDEISNKVHA